MKLLVFAHCGETYLGEAPNLRTARRMAAEHARGDRYGLHESLYATARMVGHINRVPAPPEHDSKAEPFRWFGRGGKYCAVKLDTNPQR